MLARLVKRTPRLYSWWRALSRSRILRALREPGTSPAALRRHARAALHEDRSHAGESEHLAWVLERCGIRDGYVVDLAAGDGVTQSSTLFLFRDALWRGLAVEMNAARFRRLEFAYRALPHARVVQAKVTPDSVQQLLLGHGVPRDFEVLNLDLDSYDLAVAEALLRSFQPLVVSMEVNEKIPPPIHFTVLYRPEHVWREDHFYGCSILAASELLKSRGYVLESLQYNNAFFIRADVAAGRFVDRSAADAYEDGYLNRPDRRELFPWNHDMEHLQRLPPHEALRALHHEFHGYEGKFVAEVHASATGDQTHGSATHEAGRTGQSE